MDEVGREESVLGRRLGPYVLRRRIASGGMGTVYDAYHERLEREVALKTLASVETATREDLARFLNEARAAARLAHPNVVPVFDVGEDQGVRYLAMELVRGRSLYDRIRTEGPLDPREALTIVAAACDGLQHAHDKGILHRDLKPANVLLQAPEGTPRITDFGVARAPGNQRLTQTGIALGTPNYMSPEQAMGQNDALDGRSDVWGMGAILYEALTGLPPFNGATQVETMQAVVREPLVSPRTHRAEIPTEFEAIVVRCLSKPRERRYPSAFELAEDIRRALRGEQTHAAQVTPSGNRALSHLAVTTVFVLGVVGAFLGGMFVTKRRIERGQVPGITPKATIASGGALEGHLGDLAQKIESAVGEDELERLERELTLEALRAAKVSQLPAAAIEAAARPLRARAAERRAGLDTSRQLEHLGRAAGLAPESPAGRRAWLELAQRLEKSWRDDPKVRRLRLQRELFGALAASPVLDEVSTPARLAAARAALDQFEFPSARDALAPLAGEQEHALLAALSRDLSGNLERRGGLHLFARSSAGPCLVSASSDGIDYWTTGKYAKATWGGPVTALAAADFNASGYDELVVVSSVHNTSLVTLLGLSFEGQTLMRQVARFSGHCYGLSAGDVDADGKPELLVLTGQSKQTVLLRFDAASLRARSQLVFPEGETPEGRWDQGLLLQWDGAGGDEVLLGSSEPGHPLLLREGGSEEQRGAELASLELGPVVQLTPLPREGSEAALAVVAGAEPAVVVLGKTEESPLAVVARWPFPGELSDAENARVVVFDTSQGETLLLRSYQKGDRWRLDAAPLASILSGAPAGVTVTDAPRTTRTAATFVAGELDDDPASELVISRTCFGVLADEARPAPPLALGPGDAFAALRLLGESAAADALYASLGDERPLADLAWVRAQADRANALDAASRAAYVLRDPSAAEEAFKASERTRRELVASVQALLAQPLPLEARWEARALGLSNARWLEDEAAIARLVGSATREEGRLAPQELTHWRLRAHEYLRPYTYLPHDPVNAFSVAEPLRAPLIENQVRLDLDSHSEDSLFTELVLEPTSLVEVGVDVQLRGGVAHGVVHAGLTERGEGRPKTTGLELWLYNNNAESRHGFARFVVGGAPITAWAELPALHGRLKGRIRVDLGPHGGHVACELHLGEARIFAQRGVSKFEYSVPRRAYLGAIAQSNPNGYRELRRFARRGQLGIHGFSFGSASRVSIGKGSEPHAAFGTLARGDNERAVTELTQALKTLREPHGRCKAFAYRGVAQARLGKDKEAIADLRAAFKASPMDFIWWLEVVGPALSGSEGRAVRHFMAGIESSQEVLAGEVSRSLRGDLWTRPSEPGSNANQRVISAYLTFRLAQLPATERYQDAKVFQTAYQGSHIVLPWEKFPAIVSPAAADMSDERFQELIGTTGTALHRYVANRIAHQARPQRPEPLLGLARAFADAELFGDAERMLELALARLPIEQRPPVWIEQASVHAALGELEAAAKRVEEALQAGVPKAGLAERLPLLAKQPRFRHLFE